MEQPQKYKPLNPFKLLGASEAQLRQWESEGRIRIHIAVPGEDGAAYIEIVSLIRERRSTESASIAPAEKKIDILPATKSTETWKERERRLSARARLGKMLYPANGKPFRYGNND